MQVVNLEEIWATGALLECEDALPVHEGVEIRWDSVMLAGRVRAVEAHEFGFRVEVELSALTPWSPALGDVAHAVDVETDL